MTKITLTDLVNLENQTTAVNAINANNAILEIASDNTLSRDGTSPNTMLAPIDMNSNRIVNLPNPVGLTEPVRLTDLSTFAAGGTINALPVGGTTNQVLKKNSNTNYDVSWGGSGSGTVSSVALTAPAEFNISGSPVTTTGTLGITYASTPTGTGKFVLQTSPTLTTPVIASIVNGAATLTLPSTTDTLVGRNTTDTLTNKTLTSPVMTTPTLGAASGTSLILSAGLNAGQTVITSSTATAFNVGPNGATNPAFAVDASAASLVAGWLVKGSGTGGQVQLNATDTGANTSAGINSKGTGTLNLQTSGTTGYVNVGTQVVIGGTPAEADPLWVGSTGLNVNNIGTIKASGTFNATTNHNAIIWVEPSFGSSAVITDWGALRINDANTAGGYSLDAQYQLRIQAPTKGVINQAIYCEGQGKVGLGTSNAAAHLHINDAASNPTSPPSNTSIYLSGADNAFSQFTWDAFGASGLAQMQFRRTRGTVAAPNTAVQTGDFLMNILAAGNDGAGFTFGTATIAAVVTANWTNAPSHPTALTFSTTPVGGSFASEAGRFTPAGGFTVGGISATDPGAGSILTSGSVKSQSATAGIGYATGAGNSVTQITSRATAVTINTPTGQITMFNAAGAPGPANFTVNCSSVSANDCVVLCVKSGASNFYYLQTLQVNNGNFIIQFNTSGGVIVDSPVIQYAIIKGVIV